MIRKNTLSLAIAAALASGQAGAVSDAEWETFKSKFLEMEARVKALEAENARLRGQSAVPVDNLDQLQARVESIESARADAWAERVAVKGDFRYRYESIDVEDVDRRERDRIRARVALTAALPDDVEVGFGLASGGDDPVSSNQTLGNGGSSKGVRLDKAYAKWQVVDGLSLVGGKFSNPLYRPAGTALMWDGDWRPEGVGASWSGDMLFANFLGNWLESDSGTDNDAFAWGLQGGAVVPFGDSSLTAAIAYYDFPTAGHGPFFDDDFFGNTSVDGTYLYDYELIEVGAEFALAMGDLPLIFYADYVQNQDPDDNDTGWQTGFEVGKVSGLGTWSLGYAYQDLEADALLGLLSDSDFAGGGTDGKGHRITGELGINKRWSVGFTWFLDNEAGEVNLADRGGAVSYDRLMLDTQFKY